MAAIEVINDTIREIEVILSKLLSSADNSDSRSVVHDLTSLTDKLKNGYDLVVKEYDESPDNENVLWETHCQVLFEHVAKLSKNISTASQKIVVLQEDKETMKKEILQLQEELEALKHQNFYDDREMERLQLKVGQVAYEVESAIVKKVLAGLTKSQDPHINSIVQLEKAIKGKTNYADAFETDEDRESAKHEWEKLKTELKWKGKHYRYISELKKIRTSIAHPKVDLQSLRKELTDGTLKPPLVQDVHLFKHFLDMIDYMRS